jgi:GntR family transcriptional regulator
MIHLDYRAARPIYAQIVDSIRGQIQAGILAAGERLPSVRELASELSINPNSIQRSFRQLEAEGWIATVPGKGCFVCGRPEPSEADSELLAAFDRAAVALLRIGMSREALMERLKKEDAENA